MPWEITQNSPFQPDPPPKSNARGKFWLIIIPILLVLAAATVLVLYFLPKEDVPEDEDKPKKEKIAAVVGRHELGVAEAHYFYIDYVQQTYTDWYTAYGENTQLYISMLYGLDLFKPLNGQYFDTEQTVTWAEHFIQLAMEEAAGTYALYDSAKADGFTLSEEGQQAVADDLAMHEMYAQSLGYRNLRQYLQAIYSTQADSESYDNYLTLRATAEAYYRSKEDSLCYDDAALRAYEADRYHHFSSFSYCQYFISTERFLSGGTESENGTVTYSPEEILAAEDKAQELASRIARSKPDTKEALDETIEKLDPGQGVSVFYEDVLYEDVPDALADWLCYEDRKDGDTTLIAVPLLVLDGSAAVPGYYVVLFSGRNENTMPLVNVRHILINFQGGFTDSLGITTYSDEEKAAALYEAKTLLAAYNAGERTEAAFAALASIHSDDSASADSGGLLENVHPSQTSDTFDHWCFDETRQPGDVEIIETEYGYHLMYYCGTGALTYRDFMITGQLRQQDLDTWYTGIISGITVSEIHISRFPADFVIVP